MAAPRKPPPGPPGASPEPATALIPAGSKACPRCRRLGRSPYVLPFADFYSRWPGVYESHCRRCKREQNADYMARRRLTEREQQAEAPDSVPALMAPSVVPAVRRQRYLRERLVHLQKGRCAACGFPESVKDDQGRLLALALYGNPVEMAVPAVLCVCCLDAASLLRHSSVLAQRLADFLRATQLRRGPKVKGQTQQEIALHRDEPEE